jgi:hypothetical protein
MAGQQIHLHAILGEETPMRSILRPATSFTAIGIAIYCCVALVCEILVYRTGHSNPIFKIVTYDEPQADWVILGASHAMPLAFDNFNSEMESQTELRILNLATQGTGPLYQKFVLERFFDNHKTLNILYVVDSFAFYSKSWNEERFSDRKLLSRTPLDRHVLKRLALYVHDSGIDPRVLLDYATGFSKVNNRSRFQRDQWEGEAQFEQTYRISDTAVLKRIAYLYPSSGDLQPALESHLSELRAIIDMASRNGANVTLIKMPLPQRFSSKLPNEASFDQALALTISGTATQYHDFSNALDVPGYYFDTDHLNRTGVTAFFGSHLKDVLTKASHSQ